MDESWFTEDDIPDVSEWLEDDDAPEAGPPAEEGA
jgi:hypothetical protein